jgi:hypothetical protein
MEFIMKGSFHLASSGNSWIHTLIVLVLLIGLDPFSAEGECSSDGYDTSECCDPEHNDWYHNPVTGTSEMTTTLGVFYECVEGEKVYSTTCSLVESGRISGWDDLEPEEEDEYVCDNWNSEACCPSKENPYTGPPLGVKNCNAFVRSYTQKYIYTLELGSGCDPLDPNHVGDELLEILGHPDPQALGPFDFGGQYGEVYTDFPNTFTCPRSAGPCERKDYTLLRNRVEFYTSVPSLTYKYCDYGFIIPNNGGYHVMKTIAHQCDQQVMHEARLLIEFFDCEFEDITPNC